MGTRVALLGDRLSFEYKILRIIPYPTHRSKLANTRHSEDLADHHRTAVNFHPNGQALPRFHRDRQHHLGYLADSSPGLLRVVD
jgi:hypothetical protein